MLALWVQQLAVDCSCITLVRLSACACGTKRWIGHQAASMKRLLTTERYVLCCKYMLVHKFAKITEHYQLRCAASAAAITLRARDIV
jgi:hypothetical protein